MQGNCFGHNHCHRTLQVTGKIPAERDLCGKQLQIFNLSSLLSLAQNSRTTFHSSIYKLFQVFK